MGHAHKRWQPGESLWLPPVKSCPLPLADNNSSAQFLELDNKSPWYIELSASPALVPVCIGCSLSLQLSAWGGTVNDGFVLRSPFVLSWFLEQHKQAWNLFYPPQKKMGGIQVCWSTIQRCGQVHLIPALLLGSVFRKVFIWDGKRGHSSLIEPRGRNPWNCEFPYSSHELYHNRCTEPVNR